MNGFLVHNCHKIKSPSGKYSKAIAKLGSRCARRLGLTGTPLPHSPLDVFGEYRFLDERIFGRSVVAFRSRYAVCNPRFPQQVIGYRNKPELAALMGRIMFQVRTDDVLKLPPAVHSIRPIVLSKEARKIYDDMEEAFVAWVGDAEVTAANALAKLLRLQQITSGYLKTEIDGEAQRLDDGKTEALLDLFEEIDADERVVVFCRFREDLRQVKLAAEARARTGFELSGSVASDLDAWRRTAGAVLAVQIQAGSLGVDFTAARHAIYYSLGFSLAEYEQSLARLRRPGQTAESVIYTHLVAEKSVDEKVYRALKERKNIVEAILEEARA